MKLMRAMVWGRCAVTAAALVVCVGTASSVLAQQGGGGGGGRGGQRDQQPGDAGGGGRRGQGGPGGGGMFGGGRMMGGEQISTRSIEKFSTMLNLSKDQREAVNALFEGYKTSSDEIGENMRETMRTMREEMQDGPNPDAMKRMGEEMDKVRKQRKDVETSFFDDFKAVLTPEQSAKWPQVEQTHRRESTLGRGLLSGERVDVVRLVDDLKLTPEQLAPVTPVLEQYQSDLDRELVNRNAVYDEFQSKMREWFQNQDMTAMEKAFTQGREAGTRVREVNKRYARQVESLLPEAMQAKFSESVKRESFPSIYRQSQGDRTLEAALALKDLDESQKASLATIQESHKRGASAIQREMEDAWEKREASIKPQDMMGGGMGMRGGGRGMFDDEKSQELRDRRRELDESTVDKVKAVLKPEQVEQLPKGREDRGGGPGGEDAPPRRQRNNNGDGGGQQDGQRQNRPARPPTGRT